ncbi:Endo-1,4-beta-xylanase [Pseudomonas syringae pv. primulae]|uniref:Endo-1,4-beta-xylanase n=2 Tax=Pseudomonas syringae group genomosp. 3 TaxID=251701 RepID=A0A3M4SGB0_9PSED|nr:Endo-1,4-beta-xylanase [Pseudomonas syringae pv. primulae]
MLTRMQMEMETLARLAIPAETRRAVLVESGHRCAIPRCNQTELDVHHIVPWEECKAHEYSNLIALCPTCHRRAHKDEIDRKSLRLYKENLAKEFGQHDNGMFQADVVEVRRRLAEENQGVPGFSFQFDFPDFPSTVERIVSRNIEAWGYELLAGLQETQAQNDLDPDVVNYSLSHLKNQLTGHYHVVRRDERVISILYAIDLYHSGAAHGGRSSTATNYLIRPFRPITLDYLLGNIEHLPALADYIRERLSETGEYDEDWLAAGTQPMVENFSLFNIERYGLTFTFPEYSIACFAAGEQKLWVGFDSLAPFFDPQALASIRSIETY